MSELKKLMLLGLFSVAAQASRQTFSLGAQNAGRSESRTERTENTREDQLNLDVPHALCSKDGPNIGVIREPRGNERNPRSIPSDDQHI